MNTLIKIAVAAGLVFGAVKIVKKINEEREETDKTTKEIICDKLIDVETYVANNIEKIQNATAVLSLVGMCGELLSSLYKLHSMKKMNSQLDYIYNNIDLCVNNAYKFGCQEKDSDIYNISSDNGFKSYMIKEI